MARRRWAGWLLVGVLGGATSACASDDEETGPGPQPNGLPPKEELSAGWNLIDLAGNAICARGDAYAFFARPGTVNRLVVEFEGGGACWSESSCAEGSTAFSDTVDRNVMSGTLEGIHDYENPANPFRDWWHVFVPYCTGDLHLGDQLTPYGSIEIHHRGAVNAGAVMEWVYANFPTPERIVVTGCSAGGYGSIGWAPYVMQHYPAVPVVQLADCAAGVAPPGFLVVIDGVWNSSLVTPSFIPAFADVNLVTLSLTDIYREDANYFSGQTFSQYHTQWDEEQAARYVDMGGGDVEEWSAGMNASMTAIATAADNFSYFVAAGNQHCIINHDEFYSVESGGVPVSEWVTDLAGGTATADVHCDPDCGTP